MYFWNTRQLALDLREGKVTERQQMWYLFAYVVFTILGMHVLLWVPIDITASLTMADVADIVVTIVGILACFEANSKGDGKDFVVRFICMGWPVGFRVLACFLVLALVFTIKIYIVTPACAELMLDLLGVGTTAAYFALMRHWLIKISGAKISSGTSP